MENALFAFLLGLFSLSISKATGQTNPINKKIAPVQKTITVDTTIQKSSSTQRTANNNHHNPVVVPGSRVVKPPVIPLGQGPLYKPNLYLITRHLTSDPDVKPPVWTTQYTDDEIIYDSDLKNPPHWEYDFLWTNIPENATEAGFEISTQPFPPGNTSFNGVQEKRVIKKLAVRTVGKQNSDSVRFHIQYQERKQALKVNPRLFGSNPSKPGNNPANNNISNQDRSAVKQVNAVGALKPPATAGEQIKNAGPAPLLTDQARYGYYYVRLTALDADGKQIGQFGNSIKIIPRFYDFSEPIPTSEDSLRSDYEVTAINYIQMHEPEPQFESCLVITGYSDPELMKIGLPVGSVMCPSPPEEPSFYEKATGFVTDAVGFVFEVSTVIINGASTIYNETKEYLKNKFGDLLCNYNPAVSGLKQTGIDKTVVDSSCREVAGATFDAAMTYAGMPPSIPNFDEMCKIAKGQVVELMVQKAIEESGMPCDETCKQLIMQAYDKTVSESAAKNVVSQNGISYKPDPRGQYYRPYVEIEITRKRQSQKGAPIITCLYFTPKVEKFFKDKYDSQNKKAYSVNIKTDKLYQRVELPIPYLKNIGDKIKLVVVLTPKRSYFSYSCPNGAIDGIENYQQHCEGLNVMQAEMGDPRFSSGYASMVDNATITIRPEGKMPLAAGVQTQFVHHR